MSGADLARKNMRENPDDFADLYRDIRGQFTKGKPQMVTLRHLRLHGGDADVEKWTGDYFDGLNPDDFTQTIVAAITDDARIFQGIQRYGVFFFRKNTTTHDARVLLTIQGGSTPEEVGGVFENEDNGTERGRMAQIMRHDEAYTRLAIQSMHHSLTSLTGQLTRSEALVEKLLGAHVQILERVQTLMDRTAERDFKLERQRKMYELLDEGMDKVGAFLPFLIAHKVEEKSPQLAAMIRQSAANPANEVLKLVMSEIEANPEKGQEILKSIMQLPNGPAIVQALAQMKEMAKAQAQAHQNGTKS